MSLSFRFAGLIAVCMFPSWPVQAASTWNVIDDPETISWQGVASGSEVFTGACTKFDASITFDPAALAQASVTIHIDMNACKTGDGEKDAQLPQESWFNISLFPHSVFAAKNFRHEGGNQYVADGTLTMKGVTQKVVLPFTLDIEKGKEGEPDTAHVVGATTLKRLAFGVGDGPQFSSADVVGTDVKVMIDLRATRAERDH